MVLSFNFQFYREISFISKLILRDVFNIAMGYICLFTVLALSKDNLVFIELLKKI